MTVNPISTIAEQQFRDIYLAAYQQHRMLGGTAIEVHNIIGASYLWPQTGTVDMIDRGAFNSNVTASEIDHSQVTTTFKDKVSRLIVGADEQTLINPNERQRFAMLQAAATGRQLDQFQIDAMDADAGSTIDVDSSNLTLDKVAQLRERLVAANALTPGETPYLFVHANQIRAATLIEQLTSSDFVTMRNIMSGDVTSAFGFNWITYGDSTLGGLPKTGDIRTCFGWSRSSMGLAFKMDPRMRVVWNEDKLAWQSTTQLIANSSVLQSTGVIKMECDETK